MGPDDETLPPGRARVPNGKMADVKTPRLLDDSAFRPKGSILALDRGRIDFARFHGWRERDVGLVARAKDDIAYKMVERRGAPPPPPVGPEPRGRTPSPARRSSKTRSSSPAASGLSRSARTTRELSGTGTGMANGSSPS
jgi:hypothetical protein